MKECKKIEMLAVRVAAGESIRNAAAAISWSESSAYTASRTADFRRRVAELRSDALQAAVGSLNEGSSKAVQTLIELLGQENEPQVRLNASKAILGALAGVTELGELRARLDDIESRSALKVAS